MKNWNVSTRLWLAFGGVFLITLVFSVQIYRHISNVHDRTDELVRTNWPGLYAITQMDKDVRNIYSLLNRVVLETDPRQNRDDVTQIQATWVTIDSYVKQYEGTIDSDEDRRLLNDIVSARTQAETASRALLDNLASIPKDQQLKSFRERVEPVFASFLKDTANAVAFNKNTGDADNKNVLEEVEAERIDVLWGLAIPLIFAGITGYFLVRAVNRPLSEAVSAMKGSGSQINTSAMEIAATSQQQLATANEVAATTSEVVATSKQISTTLRELMQTVKSVTEVAEQTATLAGNGQSSLGRMKNTIQQIMDASASINERLAVLSDKAGNIGAVVTTITKV